MREASIWPGEVKFYVKEAYIFTGLQELEKKIKVKEEENIILSSETE